MELRIPDPAQPSPGLRRRLREATRPEHHSLDQTMSMLDLGDALGYSEFLRLQLSALNELAPCWAEVDAADFAALRCHLANDLQQPSEDARSISRIPALSRAAQWGLAYVIRGSRLGSKVLSARVAPGFAKSYFDYLPGITWPHFLADLEHAAVTFDGEDHRQVIEGAKFAFAAYANAASARCTAHTLPIYRERTTV